MGSMRYATGILTGFLVLGLIWILWPFGPSDDAATPEKGLSRAQDGRLFTAPLRRQPAPQKEETAKTEERTATVEPAQEPEPEFQEKLFYRVAVRDGSTLRAGKTLITLDGIAGPEPGARCTDATGQDWSCGTQARSALVRLIRGRAVRCDVPGDDVAAFSARCTVAGTDLALWLVSHGWAKPKEPADDTLARAAEAARARKAGLWR